MGQYDVYTSFVESEDVSQKKTTAGRAYSCLPLLHDESLLVVKSKSHNFLHLLLLLLCLAAQVFLFVLKCCVLEESSLHSFQIVADRLASFYPRAMSMVHLTESCSTQKRVS